MHARARASPMLLAWLLLIACHQGQARPDMAIGAP
jgi:hypothetical protein